MELYYVIMEALFDDNDDLLEVEQRHCLTISNITKYYISECAKKGINYRGNNMYLFVGDWHNIVNYFLWDYQVNDITELEELVKSIKKLNF